MIVDTLEHIEAYASLHPSMSKVICFLRETDLAALELGRVDLGDDEFAAVDSYSTQPVDAKQYEAHRKYIDLQYIVEGTEWIGYAPIDRLTVCEAYDDSKDIEWLDGDGSYVMLPAGSFMMLWPHDAHKPGVHPNHPNQANQVSGIRKIVFKLRVR